jgi:hypothetical protein
LEEHSKMLVLALQFSRDERGRRHRRRRHVASTPMMARLPQNRREDAGSDRDRTQEN